MWSAGIYGRVGQFSVSVGCFLPPVPCGTALSIPRTYMSVPNGPNGVVLHLDLLHCPAFCIMTVPSPDAYFRAAGILLTYPPIEVDRRIVGPRQDLPETAVLASRCQPGSRSLASSSSKSSSRASSQNPGGGQYSAYTLLIYHVQASTSCGRPP
ncbi:hypothetical protein F5Y14DRAFT_330840 [Nemania sp. NC0429]|nr:hypothetical protein F5Y14DRAFT_330840 [Nemania sp. NC0429]